MLHSETWTFHPSNAEEHETHTVEVGDYYSRDRRVFDADGRIVEHYSAPNREVEHLIRRVEHDGDGQPIRIETWDRNTGYPEAIATIERRADGTMARKVRHSQRLGWLDVWEYDEAEREVLYTQDEDRDGQIEYRAVHRYDERGNLVFQSREYGFADPQTTYSQVESTFDEHSRLTQRLAAQAWMRGQKQRLRLEYDTDGPGYVSTLERLDGAGNLVRVEQVERWLDEARIEWRQVTYGHGSEETVATEQHRWFGEQPLERLWDHDGDGQFDAVEQWHYDAAGQLVDHWRDHDGDGVVDDRLLVSRRAASF